MAETKTLFGLTTQENTHLDARLSRLRNEYDERAPMPVFFPPPQSYTQSADRQDSVTQFFRGLFRNIAQLFGDNSTESQNIPSLVGVSDTLIRVGGDEWVLIKTTLPTSSTFSNISQRTRPQSTNGSTGGNTHAQVQNPVDVILQQAADEVTTDVVTSIPQVPLYPTIE